MSEYSMLPLKPGVKSLFDRNNLSVSTKLKAMTAHGVIIIVLGLVLPHSNRLTFQICHLAFQMRSCEILSFYRKCHYFEGYVSSLFFYLCIWIRNGGRIATYHSLTCNAYRIDCTIPPLKYSFFIFIVPTKGMLMIEVPTDILSWIPLLVGQVLFSWLVIFILKMSFFCFVGVEDMFSTMHDIRY